MSDGFLKFDLHVHTREGSACAQTPAVDVLRLAEQQGLDGVVFTDHHFLWPLDEIPRLKERAGVSLTVLTAQEVTFQGIDFLIFGWDRPPDRFSTKEDLVASVHDDGGVAVVAHPYSLLYYLETDTMAGWGVDGVEVWNSLKGGPTTAERRELGDFGLSETAGSDFHRPVFPSGLGDAWTEIPGPVNDMADVILAIRENRTRATHR